MTDRKRVDIKDALADPALREEIVEGATDFICKAEGIRPHSLSPAAQIVWDAAWQLSPVNCESHEDRRRQQIAAALRAAADQVVPDDETTPWGSQINLSEPAFSIRCDLLDIADELDPPNS